MALTGIKRAARLLEACNLLGIEVPSADQKE